jgi:outer membrane protein OmpA-like peptidoglycan-associated protein/tetratricopeptide (TPR) repeat protein
MTAMKNNSIFSIILLMLLFSFHGNAQLRKANKHFELFNYAEAIPLYLKVVDSDNENKKAEAIHKLADCYRLTNNAPKASIWYEKSVELPDADTEDYFYLGQSLRTLGEYSEAAGAFKIFNELDPDNERGEKYYQYCLEIEEWLKQPDRAETKNVASLNSKYSDFGPAFYQNGIVFSSDRKTEDYIDNTYGWTNFNYLNLFYSEPEYTGYYWSAMTEPVSMERNFNQTYHDGPAFFTYENKKVYVTKTVPRNGKKEAGSIRTYLLKIFYADVKNDKKLRYKPFFLNSNDYSVAHPTLTKNGQKIFFSSDMPGGYGGADIYVCNMEDGEWGEPQNLGEKINTPEDEVFPFVMNDSILFFSSKGHMGYGGLDIFKTEIKNSEWTAPVNLRHPVNSSYDDFSIILNESMQGGFFSSNRPEGKGADDIYAFRNMVVKEEPKEVITEDKLIAEGFVKELGSGQPIEGATVFLFNPKSGDVLILKSDENGFYSAEVDFDIPYLVKAMKNGYIHDCTPFRTPSDKNIAKYAIPRDLLLARLEINQVFQVDNIYYDLDEWFIRKDAEPALDNLVQIMKSYPISAELSSHTDSRASNAYNMELSQKRAEAAVRYIVLQGIDPGRLTAKGYGETRLVNECADGVPCTEEEHQANRRTEFKITGFTSGISANELDLSLFKEGDVIKSQLLPNDFFDNCLTVNVMDGFSRLPESDQKQKSSNSTKIKNADFNSAESEISDVTDMPVSTNRYQVQLIAVSKQIDFERQFSDISDLIEKHGITEVIENGFYKYRIGSFSTQNKASELIEDLKERGYENCFIADMNN